MYVKSESANWRTLMQSRVKHEIISNPNGLWFVVVHTIDSYEIVQVCTTKEKCATWISERTRY